MEYFKGCAKVRCMPVSQESQVGLHRVHSTCYSRQDLFPFHPLYISQGRHKELRGRVLRPTPSAPLKSEWIMFSSLPSLLVLYKVLTWFVPFVGLLHQYCGDRTEDRMPWEHRAARILHIQLCQPHHFDSLHLHGEPLRVWWFQ